MHYSGLLRVRRDGGMFEGEHMDFKFAITFLVMPIV